MSVQEDGGWVRIAAASEVPDGDVKGVTVEGKALAVYRINGEVFVTTDVCTHAKACLSDGYLDGETIECPLHQGLFHVPSGKALGAPATEPLETYEVKLQGESICVRLDQVRS
ncbi:MAG: non-heme iron oxygenase ferredoxin subunit [Burkholderiaceae bacterium]|nr:non-heme iron oxygenase ferredoxin subunit [Burkholderiaceae bacterium]